MIILLKTPQRNYSEKRGAFSSIIAMKQNMQAENKNLSWKTASTI